MMHWLFRWLRFPKKQVVFFDVAHHLVLVDCQIHGSHYYECLSLVKAKAIQRKDHLRLVREPDNEFDANAIEVFTQQGEKLGYVPKNNNTVIANLMDQHCLCTAVVSQVYATEWNPVTMTVYLTKLPS